MSPEPSPTNEFAVTIPAILILPVPVISLTVILGVPVSPSALVAVVAVPVTSPVMFIVPCVATKLVADIIPELLICDAVIVFTVTLGVPVKASACVALDAVPVKSPTNPPVEVVMPETIALPNTSNFCLGVTEPIPTLLTWQL